MLIITSGRVYSDIDIVASALPYKNLCDLKGIPAKAVLAGPLNDSVPQLVRNLGLKFETGLREDPSSCQFVIVDFSEPKFLPDFVKQDNIIKVFDHRFLGWENYWKDKLGNDAHIEPVGACATLIWEEYIKEGLTSKISTVDANLLYIAIICHTLNLKSSVTSDRDRNALNSLKPLTNLPQNFLETYYNQVNESFMNNPEEAMRNDTKIQEIGGIKYGIIQVELWDSRKFIESHQDLILKTLTSLKHPEGVIDVGPTLRVFLTSPSISEGHNYIVTGSDEVKNLLEKSIGAKFSGNIGQTPKLYLRKEIIKILAQLN